MNTPDIKDILQKLSVLKNNKALLASIIIVLVAILLFIPTTLMSKSLTEQVEKESLGMGRKISAALRNPVAMSLPEEMKKHGFAYSCVGRAPTHQPVNLYIPPARADAAATARFVAGPAAKLP